MKWPILIGVKKNALPDSLWYTKAFSNNMEIRVNMFFWNRTLCQECLWFLFVGIPDASISFRETWMWHIEEEN